MARPKRFELLTPKFVVWCSIQLSYGRTRPPPGGGCAPDADAGVYPLFRAPARAICRRAAGAGASLCAGGGVPPDGRRFGKTRQRAAGR